ncbi:MAG: hypothetical protein KDE53_38800, partial [Caldilineaceae bacterium]|nr:hypothetical protein [Caldilineaceae bacterium]
PPVKLGKFVYEGVMLEVSYLAWSDLPSAETILSTAHLAGSFQGGTIIADPTGRLTALEQEVAPRYANREWVEQRVEGTAAKIRHNLAFGEELPFHHQVMAWLFGTGVTTHLLLVAGLRNPTVRKRYLAVRTLLNDYQLQEQYEPLLALLGCAALTAATVQRHLHELTQAYDAAKAVIKSPFFFAADIHDMSRPVAIGGSQELIDAGDHREAIFWIVATYARCMIVFTEDAPALLAQYTPGFFALLADLGIKDHADLVRRRTMVLDTLPQLRQLATVIMDATPEIQQ